MINFEWYRSFVAVYQLGTVSAAAQQRILTQPAISQHLAALEHALQTPLFQRTARRMIPTEAGKALYTRVIGAIEQLERGSQPHSKTDTQKPFRLGAPREYLIARALHQLETLDSALHLTFGQTHTLIKQLEAEQLDAIIATQRIARRAIHYQPLLEEHFLLVGSAHLRLPAYANPDEFVRWAEQQRWIAYASDLPIIRRYWQECFGRRIAVTPHVVLPDLLVIASKVAEGFGVSILPDYLCQPLLEEGKLQELWKPDLPPPNMIYLACLKASLSSNTLQHAIRLLSIHFHPL
jgi:DNA-binding transcriptional LysR family regulator